MANTQTDSQTAAQTQTADTQTAPTGAARKYVKRTSVQTYAATAKVHGPRLAQMALATGSVPQIQSASVVLHDIALVAAARADGMDALCALLSSEDPLMRAAGQKLLAAEKRAAEIELKLAAAASTKRA